jgi:hypothetical protein
MRAMSSKVTPVSFSTYTFAQLLPIDISPLWGVHPLHDDHPEP